MDANDYGRARRTYRRAIREALASALDQAAQRGYDGQLNGHIYSAPAWYAFELGRYFRARGLPCPVGVRMGRGYHIWAGMVCYRIDGGQMDPRFTVKS